MEPVITKESLARSQNPWRDWEGCMWDGVDTDFMELKGLGVLADIWIIHTKYCTKFWEFRIP